LRTAQGQASTIGCSGADIPYLRRLVLENQLRMTAQQFAKTYSLSQEVAYELVYYDFIKAERMPNMRGGGWHTSRDNIERFFQEYVFATEIAEKLGIVSIMVRRLLEERGIFPVSGPGVDGAKKLLYRRTAEIEQFIRDYSDRQGGEFSLS
jgi:hypothetical protein